MNRKFRNLAFQLNYGQVAKKIIVVKMPYRCEQAEADKMLSDAEATLKSNDFKNYAFIIVPGETNNEIEFQVL